MSDHLDRAAAIVGGCCAHCDDLVDERLALLDEAGLLASPERDAAVAAKALREAADTFARFANSASTSERSRHGWESARGVLLRMAEEREAGESGGDA